MAETRTSPGADPFLTLLALTDLVTPYAIRAAVSLDIPAGIAAGARTAEALAERNGLDRRATANLTAFLARKGVFAETADGLALTPVGQLLTTPQARLMLSEGGAAEHLNRAWISLAHAVRTGEAGYPTLFGRDFWDTLANDPPLSESFDRYMDNWGTQWIPAAVAARDWAADGHVVDVGGGAGKLLCALLAGHPALRGSVVDLQAAAGRARATLAAAGLTDRGEALDGSFFDPLPTHGDTYVLAQVLHDWPDAQALAILRRCAQAAGPDGRVLVIERVMAEPASEAHLVSDLFMLVLFGARERTLAEFGELAANARLEAAGVQDIGFGLSIVELRPAGSPSRP
ncbi:methyltransferase [Phenylobacterium sp.]|uniref:methyltransferase n=1 Tax=Phenylobacterium sp. TaxID=1871053 RepID=UPI00301C55B2